MSRLVSLDYFATVGLMPLGYALVGPLAGQFGLEPVMLVAGIAIWAIAVLATRAPDVRRLSYASVPS